MTIDRRASQLAAGLLLVAAGGCGNPTARVKGRVVENGQPVSFAGALAALEFTPVGKDDKPTQGKAFTAVLDADGAFEVFASGGELPTGRYQVSFQVSGKAGERFKSLAGPASPIRRDLRSGANELLIDLAKPNE